MSADVGDALLGLRLSSGLGMRGKREDRCVLPFIESRQQHDLAIGELKRVMIGVKRALIDLAKDRNGVVPCKKVVPSTYWSSGPAMRLLDAEWNAGAPAMCRHTREAQMLQY